MAGNPSVIEGQTANIIKIIIIIIIIIILI